MTKPSVEFWFEFASSEEAVARGIFGAPTFLIGSELYWGNDRLEDALAYCAGLRSS
jgi:2-hydroxychromene-2-carboxylate isomerase